jgi:hypothetical protein
LGCHLAREKITPAARTAMAAVAAVPPNPDALTCAPPVDLRPYRIDSAGDLMSGNPRILNARPVAFLRQRVAVANSTRLDLHAHRAGVRLRNGALHQLKGSVGLCYLNRAHLGHGDQFEPIGWYSFLSVLRFTTG